MKTTYIGASYQVAESIFFSDNFDLSAIVCEKTAANSDLLLFGEVFNIPVLLVENKTELEKALLDLSSEVFVMYGFGIIIPENITDRLNIFNLHTGSLKNHRGRHPIERAVLQNDKTAEINLYKINKEIDLGELVAKEVVNINLLDVSLDIHQKLLECVPNLLKSLNDYLSGKIKSTFIDDGKYEKRVSSEDYTINLEEDTIADIYNKIRAQAKYNGALLNVDGKSYNIRKLGEIEFLSEDLKSVKNSVLEINKSAIICKSFKYRIELIF